MKRITAIFLTLFSLLICFTSCAYTDTHVKAESDETLVYKGQKYRLVSDEDVIAKLSPVFTTQVYVTGPMTPGPLAKWLHEDSLGTLASSRITDNGYFIMRNYRGIYCREDIYNDLDTLLSEREYDCYIYEYHVDGRYMRYTLTEEEMSAVDKVFVEVKPVASYELGYIPITEHYIDLLYLDSETMTATFLQRLQVLKDGYCFTRLRDNGTTEYYIVPKELEKCFDGITKAYTDAYDY